jgi:hypothetical protein
MKTRIKQLLIGLTVASALCATSVNAKWYKDENGKSQWQDDISKSTGNSNSGGGPDKAAIARTRQQVLMLDDLYKTAVVAITEHYVKDPSTLSAASAAKVLFAAMKAKGWHDARLLGFTNVLFNPSENKPKDDFERAAKQKILAGAANYEAVETQGGKQIFRMATAVPVVMEKCVMCHADFKGVKGAIGAISYSLPLVQ